MQALPINSNLSISLLKEMDKPLPRYTSYPTAPHWDFCDDSVYRSALIQFDQTQKNISLYIHIPFCQSMCLFCGCSVILNRKEEPKALYVEYLKKEIKLLKKSLAKAHTVTQLHFGGGTPTELSCELWVELMGFIRNEFDFSKNIELSVEIDPRTVVRDNGEKLRLLKQLGFNRVSFGVQDTNPQVQEAIRRRQSLEQSFSTYQKAKDLNFKSINIDLIYGLPLQTPSSFKNTIDEICLWKPNRIALFSFAYVPWIKSHQNALKSSDFPSVDQKFEMYLLARQRLVESGYLCIGMDHFALPDDELAQAYLNKQMQRNFQGYSLKLAEDLIGIGVSSTGCIGSQYIQNAKDLQQYYQCLDNDQLPTVKGKILSMEDNIRRWVIHTLMCTFELSFCDFQNNFGFKFSGFFEKELKSLEFFESKEMVTIDARGIYVCEMGQLFVRNIAAVFDTYLTNNNTKFSRSI